MITGVPFLLQQQTDVVNYDHFYNNDNSIAKYNNDRICNNININPSSANFHNFDNNSTAKHHNESQHDDNN
jgi:hypothetical protein